MKVLWRRRIGQCLLWLLVVILLLLAGTTAWMLRPVQPYAPFVSDNPQHVAFFAIGDQGTGRPRQWQVAHAMEHVAEADPNDTDFVMLMGDNFYGPGLASEYDLQWRYKFENVYQGKTLRSLPFYAVLGNNDLAGDPDIQVRYSRERLGSGRFTMPARYYWQDYGKVGRAPLLRAIYLDTTLRDDALKTEVTWLQDVLAMPGPKPVWLVIAGHYPVRSSSKHGDVLLETPLGRVIRSSGADLYIAGHDHAQQLQLGEGNEPVFMTPGSAGQSTMTIRRHPPTLLFASEGYGFAKIAVDPQRMGIRFYDGFARLERAFVRDRSCIGPAAGCLKPVAPGLPPKS